MKYLMFIFVLASIILSSSVMAFDWDNVKSYDENTRTITVKDSIFGIPTTDVATIKLDTPLDVFVLPGQNRKVAEFTINNYENNYDVAFKEMEFYNTKDNQPLDRTFSYKYKTTESFQVNDYEWMCTEETETKGKSERLLSNPLTDASPVIVNITATFDTLDCGGAIVESVPQGWDVSSISGGGFYNSLLNTITFAPLDAVSCGGKDDTYYLGYILTPRIDEVKEETFSGVFSIDGKSEEIGGSSIIKMLSQCERRIVASHQEERVTWTELTPETLLKLPEGSITIAIFTDVLPGDHVEWIPTLFGVRIDEWATWTDSLNIGLVAYYTMNQSTGNFTDAITGQYNFSSSGFSAQGIPGVINNSGRITAKWNDVPGGQNNVPVNNLPNLNLTGQYTISFWSNVSNYNANNVYPLYPTGFSTDRGIQLVSTSVTYYWKCGGSTVNTAYGVGNIAGNWYLITVMVNSSGLFGYVNGTLKASTTCTSIDGFTGAWALGQHNIAGQTSAMDELAFWNRSLTPTEISDLYNAGAGISYIPTSGGDTTRPYFTTIPANLVINYGQGFKSDFVATDAVAFGTYAINWTNSFQINSTGSLQNITKLGVGVYKINVTINDSSNNINSTIYNVNVSQISPTVRTFVNGSQSNLTVNNGTIVMLNSTLVGEFGSLNLSIGSTQLNYSTTMNLSYPYNFSTVGIFTISTNYSGNTNYTSGYEQWSVNVTNGAVIPTAYYNLTNYEYLNYSTSNDITRYFNATSNITSFVRAEFKLTGVQNGTKLKYASNYTATNLVGTNTYRFAGQTFNNTNSSFYLTSLSIQVSGGAGTGCWIFDAPNGTLLEDGTNTNVDTCILNSPLLLTQGQNYFFVFNMSTTGANREFFNNSDPYPYGHRYTCYDGPFAGTCNSTVNDLTRDLYFSLNSSTFPQNVSVKINTNTIFNWSGEFAEVNYTLNDFSSILNQYLNSTYILGNYYRIPFVFHSDSEGILQYVELLFTSGTSINNVTYNGVIYDTDNSTFTANVSLLNTTAIYSANLIYNGTSYLASYTNIGGGNYLLSRTIDIPIVYSNTNRSWYFRINYDSGGFLSENLTTYNQSVLVSRFGVCNTSLSSLGINYSIYNETDLALVTSTFKATHFWYLGGGTVKKNMSVDLSGANNYTFCIEPNDTFYVDSDIKLTAPGFFDRTFSLPKQRINSTATQKALYLLDSAVGSTIITEFRNTQLVPLPGYYLNIFRYYPSLNQYINVHTDRTDNFGVVVANLVESTVKYRFNYTDYNGTVVKDTPNDVTIACRTSICVLTFIREQALTDFDTFRNLSQYEYTLTFDNVTNTFLYTWNDNRGELPNHRLLVERIAANGTTVVCNMTSSDLIGALSCAVGDSYASYSAQAFRHASPERRIALLTQKVGDITGRFGIEGLLWSFILLMTMVAIGYWSPPVGIGLYLAGFIILGITGIIYVNPAIIVAQLAVGIAFIWAFRS